jgi:hypothetical protein
VRRRYRQGNAEIGWCCLPTSTLIQRPERSNDRVSRARLAAWALPQQHRAPVADVGDDARVFAVLEAKAVTLPEPATKVPAAAVQAPAFGNLSRRGRGHIHGELLPLSNDVDELPLS